MNFVNRFLIGKTTGANTGTTLPTIVAGDIIFVNGLDQSILDTAAKMAAVSDTTPIYAAMGLALGQVRLSFPIVRRSIEKFTRQPYRAKAEQIDSIDLTTLVAGGHYKVIVVLKDEMRTIADRQTKLEIPDFVATGNLAADGAKLASLITKFRGTVGMLVGSFATPNLVITGQPVPAETPLDEYQYVAFSTSFTKMSQFTDPGGYPSVSNGTPLVVVTTQKADGGSGNPAQLLKTELEASGYLGNNDLTDPIHRPSAISRIDRSAQYDLIDLLHFDRHQGDHEFTMLSPLRTTFALVAGSALSASVEILLKAFYSKDALATTSSAPDPDQAGGL